VGPSSRAGFLLANVANTAQADCVRTFKDASHGTAEEGLTEG
jgi:hypothetical protein